MAHQASTGEGSRHAGSHHAPPSVPRTRGRRVRLRGVAHIRQGRRRRCDKRAFRLATGVPRRRRSMSFHGPMALPSRAMRFSADPGATQDDRSAHPAVPYRSPAARSHRFRATDPHESRPEVPQDSRRAPSRRRRRHRQRRDVDPRDRGRGPARTRVPSGETRVPRVDTSLDPARREVPDADRETLRGQPPTRSGATKGGTETGTGPETGPESGTDAGVDATRPTPTPSAPRTTRPA